MVETFRRPIPAPCPPIISSFTARCAARRRSRCTNSCNRRRSIGPGEFQGRLYDLGRYPGVVASDDPADIVHGEVYRLHDPAATLARLDQYEGCDDTAPAPTEYRARRRRHPACPAAAASRRTFTFISVRSTGLRRIESGDYLDPGGKLI